MCPLSKSDLLHALVLAIYNFPFHAPELCNCPTFIQPQLWIFHVQGLHLDGAAWDPIEHCLCEPLPSQPSMALPILHLRPASNAHQEVAVACSPLYQREVVDSNGHRTCLANVHLPPGSNNANSHLIYGTAIFLSPP